MIGWYIGMAVAATLFVMLVWIPIVFCVALLIVLVRWVVAGMRLGRDTSPPRDVVVELSRPLSIRHVSASADE
jgi:uncharacterized MAPEG superfamily protein